ncbi:hypothetical protein I3J13_19725 [Agrobacterium sp. MOPV5]|uniref:hypothetical protein n=1 Tax=Agrobacterium leguminum TaxID=2792015 RepID=UPI0018C24583|nr:hypothetical protein [Agrobacterium leguminum]MBG0511016.1 hypothetical protein [Agrobacterium leguminum]
MLLYKSASANTQIGISVSIKEHSLALKEAIDNLAACRTSRELEPVVVNCREAATLLLEACTRIEAGLSSSGLRFHKAFDALDLLKRAYRLLAVAADDQAGMPMVSYCNCCAGIGLATRQAF